MLKGTECLLLYLPPRLQDHKSQLSSTVQDSNSNNNNKTNNNKLNYKCEHTTLQFAAKERIQNYYLTFLVT